jgi:WD40 repeat protein
MTSQQGDGMSFSFKIVFVGILTVGWIESSFGDSPQNKPPSPENSAARLDLYGDPLPAEAIARMGTVRFRHAVGVRSICFFSNRKALISAGGDGIRMWDTATAKELRFFGNDSVGANSLSLSPDGRFLASGGFDKLVHLWDIASGKEVRHFEGHQSQIDCVVFSPDGKLLASAGGERAIRVWEVKNGQEVFRLVGHEGQQVAGGAINCQIRCLAFSPNGKMLASAGFQDRSIRIWDMTTGQQVRRLQGHSDGVLAVVFSADGKFLFSGSNDETIRMWDTSSGRELRRLEGSQGAVYCVAVSPDGKTLASGIDVSDKLEAKDLDRTICLWDVASGKLLRRLPGPHNQALSIVFSPDGKTLASGGADKAIHWLDLALGKELNQFPGHHVRVSTVAISADGTTLASSAEDYTVCIWNMATGKELHTLHGPQTGYTPWESNLAFSPDGRKLACVFGDSTIRLLDSKTAKEIINYNAKSLERTSLAYAPDCKAVAFANDKVGLVKLDTGLIVEYWKGGDTAACVTFSANGKFLASGHAGGKIRIWNLASKEQLHQLRGEQPYISALAFSPDGKYLASANTFGAGELTKENRSIYLWEVARGKQFRVLEGHEGPVFGIGFSPDGKLLASGTGNGREHKGNTVRLWEIASGMERRRFLGHGAPITSVAFSSDGRKVASGSVDSTILVWDVTGRLRGNGLQPLDLSNEALKELWADMAGEDGYKTHEAIWTMVSAANQAVPFLKQHLRPAEPADPHQLALWIADLDNRDFEVRNKADLELEKLGELAEPVLREALVNASTAEVRRRVERILEQCERSILPPHVMQGVRAIEALEHIGSPEAINVIQVLAGGTPNAKLTKESKVSLERLTKRPHFTP